LAAVLAVLGLLLFGALGFRAELLTDALPPLLHDGSRVDASSIAPGSSPAGAVDGNRFATEAGHCWQGRPGEKAWWWQITFAEPRTVGAILQVVGDHAYALRNAPRNFVWQASADGRSWEDLKETSITGERRLFRLHRLGAARRVRGLRLRIDAAEGTFPTLREVEFYADPKAKVPFPPWAVVVTTTGDRGVPAEGKQFIPLAKACAPKLEAQNVWLGDFHEAFLAVEPRPLCAFLSGNFIDWCQQRREHWRGVQEVLQKGHLPMWASCGGAQGLAILTEHGLDQPWDCPHCRDPQNPRTPIYGHIGHIGHTARKPCGDYSACRFERGPCNILQAAADPAFAGLPREFRAVESHCGQIEWVPRGWRMLAVGGQGSLTRLQCLRVKDRYIYAAQFHIELDGTPASSRAIMGNFLNLARQWGGYNPQAHPVAEPRPFVPAPSPRDKGKRP
jgi:hypothetical protein